MRTHSLERALLLVVGAHLAFLPWALGTMHVWSQTVSIVASGWSLLLSVWPRTYREHDQSESAYRVRMERRLFAFPVFWIGAAFLGYIVVQGVNPSFTQVPTKTGQWLAPTAAVGWLPSGLRTPFAEGSPWRSLMIYGSAWLSGCAVWTGFTRRTTLRWLLVIVAANGWLLAVLGLLQRASHTDRIFWLWHPPAGYFVASFIYRNHAGAYFNLVLAIACALTLYVATKGQRGRRSGEVVILAFMALVIAEAVLCSYSRGATLLMAAFLAVVGVVTFRWIVSSVSRRRALLVAALAGVAVPALLLASLFVLRADHLLTRLRDLGGELAKPAENVRVQLAKATWVMAQDRWARGWGAGSYRHIFPGYQAAFPRILIAPDSNKRLIFEHAHNDFLELFAEFGVAGSALLMAAFSWCVASAVRLGAHRDKLALLLLVGCALTMAHASFDFPFANPAVLVTWCCLWPIALRWLEIERAHGASRAAAMPRFRVNAG